MGFVLPPPRLTPMDAAHLLIARKEAIQAELDRNFAVLSANRCTFQTPLVDPEGFPRADIDVYAVRHARVRIIELRNDMEAIMNDIGKALEGVYDPRKGGSAVAGDDSQQPSDLASISGNFEEKAFAKVDGVAPGSPAAQAGLKRDDIILKFGSLTASSFETQPLKHLTELVASHEDRVLELVVLRSESQKIALQLIPRKGWGGRGLLGCHIIPIAS